MRKPLTDRQVKKSLHFLGDYLPAGKPAPVAEEDRIPLVVAVPAEELLPETERQTAPDRVIAPRGSSIELGPSLPMSVFTSTEAWNAERIGALALYCSDGRWGDAFDEFCHKRLQIPRYDRFAVPGGPAWLTPRDGNTDDLYLSAREQLDFLVRVHKLERIVLITHYACAFYGERLRLGPEECLTSQAEDVKTAAGLLASWFANVRVEAYLAMRRDNCLSFHTLEV